MSNTPSIARPGCSAPTRISLARQDVRTIQTVRGYHTVRQRVRPWRHVSSQIHGSRLHLQLAHPRHQFSVAVLCSAVESKYSMARCF